MNFLRGACTRSGSGSALRVGEALLPLPDALRLAEGAPILAGLRPEHVKIAVDGAGLPGRVELIEPMGVTTLVHVAAAGEALKVLSFDRLKIEVGMPVGLQIAAEQLHLFDPATEQRTN